jgi:hypothetical protein
VLQVGTIVNQIEEVNEYIWKKVMSPKVATRENVWRNFAELQEDTVETDKGFVVKAAGAFVGLIVILVGIGAASGVLNQLLINNAVGYS